MYTLSILLYVLSSGIVAVTTAERVPGNHYGQLRSAVQGLSRRQLDCPLASIMCDNLRGCCPILTDCVVIDEIPGCCGIGIHIYSPLPLVLHC
jgi:hypothetical protein